MKELTRTDIGEIEFQIGYYTELSVLSCKRNTNLWDMILSKYIITSNDVYRRIEYIITIEHNNSDKVLINAIHAINGSINDIGKLEENIQRGLDIFNRLRG